MDTNADIVLEGNLAASSEGNSQDEAFELFDETYEFIDLMAEMLQNANPDNLYKLQNKEGKVVLEMSKIGNCYVWKLPKKGK